LPTEKPDECGCCGFKTPELKEFASQFGFPQQSFWYCALCSGTVASRAHREQGFMSHEGRMILQGVCYVGNAILAVLKERK
jgi:hypothetical protein